MKNIQFKYYIYSGIALASLILFIYFLTSDSKQDKFEKSLKEKKENKTDTNATPQDKSGNFVLNDFYIENKYLTLKTDEIFGRFKNDTEIVAQMVVTSAGKGGKPENEVLNLIKNKKVGGVVILTAEPNYCKKIISTFNVEQKQSGGLPLIFSSDAEPSLMASRFGRNDFPKTINIGKPERSFETAAEIAVFLKELGIRQNFAPVCDLAINQEIISDRSFGNNSEKVKKLSEEFIKGTQSKDIAATAKHFPGHGNVKGDSHKGLVYIEEDLIELPMFENAIKNNVISIMVGHIAINKGKYKTELPASLSRNIVTDLLKGEMHFKGIVITDALNMGATVKLKKPALQAVLAGNDMILMPSDELKLINSVVEEISKDANLKNQIYISVKKIIRLKVCLGLIN